MIDTIFKKGNMLKQIDSNLVIIVADVDQDKNMNMQQTKPSIGIQLIE